jgi:hypothetical protein
MNVQWIMPTFLIIVVLLVVVLARDVPIDGERRLSLTGLPASSDHCGA